MLSINQTSYNRSDEHPVVPGIAITAEGQALVADYTNGSKLHVKPSTGVAGEKFVGIGLSHIHELSTVPAIAELKVTEDALKFELAGNPLPGSIIVREGGTEITAEPAPKAGSYSLTGNVVEFLVDDRDKTFEVVYAYTPTVAQARGLQGDANPGFSATAVLGSTGVIKAGTVYTSRWDTKSEWKGDSTVKLGTDGNLTTSGTGEVVPCIIIEIPTAGSPFLAISFNV